MPYDILYIKNFYCSLKLSITLKISYLFLVLFIFWVNEAKFFNIQNLYFQVSILESSIYSIDETIVGATCNLCFDTDLKSLF